MNDEGIHTHGETRRRGFMADNEDVLSFYDAMAADYHLIFQDWVQAQEQQGYFLDRLIRQHFDESRYPLTVLDCACGIGTQAIGLARQGGYRIHGSDISAQALARAESEARQAEISVSFSIADMRRLGQTIAGQFDVVMVMDNAIPHLLSDADLHLAARELRAKTRAGGLLLASTRDYDRLLEERPQLTSQRIIPTAEGVRVVFQVWQWQEEQYRLTQFFVVQHGQEWRMRSYTTFYRALRRDTLTQALSVAGFGEVSWLMPTESGFYQPIVLATA
jgi:glycine/sarcosine N-methyltransferase